MGEQFKINKSNKKITFVVGPTAVGKSNWALNEAIKNNGVILNADSIQIYKYFNIGSAKPPADEIKLCPHLLFDFVDPLQDFTAGDYQRAALSAIELVPDSKPTFIVGGSGFYIRALEYGMFDIGVISAHVKAQIQEWTINKQLFAELKTRDVEAALKIGEADSYRLGRALEIVLTLGKTMKQVEVEFRLKSLPLSEKYNVSKIGFIVERTVLRKIIQLRTEKMLSQGLVEEVDQLIKKGFAKSKAMSSVGYKDCQNYLMGQISQSELKDAIITSTMQLAKKQMTWFKRDPKIEWREGFYKQT